MLPFDPISVLLFIITCIFLVTVLFKEKEQVHENYPPGPKPWPIIGNILNLNVEKPYLSFQELAKKYGPVFSIKIGVQKMVVLCGYDTVKEALVNQAEEFSDRPSIPVFMEITRGYGLVFSNGHSWKALRRFTLSTLRDFGMGKRSVEDKITEESNCLVETFKSYKGEPFDNTMRINAAVANIIISLILGHRFDYDDPKLQRLLVIVMDNARIVGTPMAMLAKKYGPVFSIKIGVQKMVVLSGYETVKEALVNQAEEFSDRPTIPAIMDATRGYGLIFANGHNWKAMRRFALSTLRDFGMGKKSVEDKITEESNCLVETFKSYKGDPFDNTMRINSAVANIIISLILGHRFVYNDPKLLRLLVIIMNNVRIIGSPMAMLYNAFPALMRWIPGSHQTVRKTTDELHSFIREVFTKQRDELDVNDQRNLIDSFLVKQKEEKPELYFHDLNLTTLVADLFGAGMETTSTTLRWGLLLMMKYPKVQENVQKEIEEVIGSAEPQLVHRQQMPYTEAVIHEIQRFANLVPTNVPRMTTQDVTLKGFFIPKGTHIIPSLTSVLRDTKYFKKPDEFYPQHFLDSNGRFVKNEAFIPFSVGKRSCVGENLAKMELFLFFTKLLQTFTFKAPPGAKLDLNPAVGFTLTPQKHEICAIPRK
ncbi:cytochrome P450 2K6-like [Hyla sarda]|uniref:cytochrome P450 2K6-like n=1 Tax=Hyla sarda TaxID=327740 RepID=UPI0024C21A8F|nr:cytochrome P450 2K6-like [Hyla sarda]